MASIAAILAALERRLARLDQPPAGPAVEDQEPKPESDQRFAGEWEERQATLRREFFAGERELLVDLIGKARTLKGQDHKLAAFLDELVAAVLRQNPAEKMVVFTEYRATQDYLAAALSARFGASRVDVIHGSLDTDERRAAIARFEDEAQFLVSTEAGGEGINLHRRCHILVNFDLPWNPMRLVQRIGRLYRYGQSQRVVASGSAARGGSSRSPWEQDRASWSWRSTPRPPGARGLRSMPRGCRARPVRTTAGIFLIQSW